MITQPVQEPQVQSTWQAATPTISTQFSDPYLGNSCPFHCVKCSSTCIPLSCWLLSDYMCLPMINSHERTAALVIWGCHTGWAEWCAAAQPSGIWVGGVGSTELGADAANSEGSEVVTAQIMTILWWEDVGQLTAVSPIAWKRRVNQQETHQPSIKSLSACNPILSQHFVCMYELFLLHPLAWVQSELEILYDGWKLCTRYFDLGPLKPKKVGSRWYKTSKKYLTSGCTCGKSFVH